MIKDEELCIELLNKCLNFNPQEINELDWKEDISIKPDRLKKHLSAFANYSGGGFLVFGVKDNGVVAGLNNTKSSHISEMLSNLARTALEPSISIQPFTFEYSGKLLLGIRIKESKVKPVHYKGKSIDESYIRAGGQSRKMNLPEVKRSILASAPSRFEEIEVYVESSTELGWLDKFDFAEFLKRTRPSGFTDQNGMLEHLFTFKLLSRFSSTYRPTNLCVLTCAKNLEDFPGFEKFGIRFLCYPAENRLTAEKDIIFNGGYTLALDKIVSEIILNLPHSEVIEAATRKNVPVIPPIVVRELIANAIIHRDLTRNDSCIVVELFKDRLEITNPGSLLSNISIDRLIDHPSQSRNEVLADFMRKLNFSEERGSGIDKVIDAVEVFGLPPVLFSSSESHFTSGVYLPKSFSKMTKEERIEAVYQHACLNYVFQKKTNNSSLRYRFKFSNSESTKVYRLLQDVLATEKIKIKDKNASKKDISYLPYWA